MLATRYHHPALRQLTEQLRYSPVERRVEQVDRAEQLYYRISDDSTYPYQDLCERITGFRPEKYPDLKIDGDILRHDLQMFVEDLSASANIPVESASEPVLTVDDLSARYNVSTKTVSRWRKRGLLSRKFKFGNRSRVGFLRSSVERFVALHQEEIQRGEKFSQFAEDEKVNLIQRARELASRGELPSAVARRIAKEFGRSPEAVRYTLKQYDSRHPDTAVFPNAKELLTEETRQFIYEQFKHGTPVGDIAKQCERSKKSVYRIVNEVRAETLAASPIAYMDSEEFHASGAETVILGKPPEVAKCNVRTKVPPGLPSYLASLYTVPLLTREQEQYYFRKMNFLKFKAEAERQKIDARRPRVKQLDLVEKLVREAHAVKNFLIRSNLRLVVSIAKRHMTPSASFFEMVSDGNMSLIRAIEKFDYTKGNKFSTYATWAIMKNYARSIPAESRQLDRFRTGNDEAFLLSPEERTSQYADESNNARQHEVIMSILDKLDDRERSIIVHRFGLERGTEPETLEQVGERMGVTKERIRQIESRAMQKIRKIAAIQKVDVPGFE
ncbi:MAG: sigma-70 family RNA polymerase sigma factor [Planctomycetaceae bacterium]|nr:sigma-70 family RNA polymerase sigma factor [Planctomycetaceae bacterium]MCB9950501.1 sigma-70 family RNA polymerase sigma factor [Planctomycetaceae bacterium]